MKLKEIKKLDTWDMSDTVFVQDGYDRKTLPEATAKNMMSFMEKINQLSTAVNLLLAENKLLKKEKDEL